MAGDPHGRLPSQFSRRWRTNLSESISRTRLGLEIKDATLGLPPRTSRALNIARYLPLYLADPDLRRQWRAEDALERTVAAGELPRLPLDERSAGTSERTVEVPWVLARGQFDRGRRILDVGSTFAPHAYRRLLTLAARRVELHLVDLLPSGISGATAHRADARALPFDTGSFDTVICISTLEHIGMDNVAYGLPTEVGSAERPDVMALRELARVARRTPGLLVTVPGGCAADFGWSRQYSADSWSETVAMAGLNIEELAYFAHFPVGWRACQPAELDQRTYGEGARAAAAVICARLSRRDA